MRLRPLQLPFVFRGAAALLTTALLSLVPAPAAAQGGPTKSGPVQGGQFQVTAQTDSRRLAPLRVDFAARVPGDVAVRWDFGDGQAAQGPQVSHTYYRPGRYAAQVILSREGREVGRSQMTVEVKSQGAEKAGLVLLLGRGTVTLSDVGSVVYVPYQSRFTLDGQQLGGPTASLQAGTHTASVQIAAGAGTLSRSLRFQIPAGELRSSPTYEDQVLRAVNLLRQSRYNCATGRTDGVARPPLTRMPALDRAALAHALAMPTAGFVDHTSRLDGSTPAQRIQAAGYPNASTAENIAAGQPTPAEAVAGWLDSPGHCAALMGDYTQTGLSYVQVPGSDYVHYWVQVFGRPQP
ncbi:SCP-like extracellular [Deinococcus proteolyticus MRP]|uniref:SCP-like extracellular n=1 Tax=Deinococcus proteolyticus (strain ATCC 35074 / DSM 20540 / JCM 6276 / NBRC 101906 / NCIMB 13154 / VKM Ac-1939 / CCM 2703 / MRP) TaxID=693977 RepID=F0RJH5_DEIPM|nr:MULTISPECIES: CAP domain-containing protein [Deinococcus]ADY25516.1 SCP-like extracellular [Deinococcus proteolyticus MRP]MCY1701636.1 CAP domain-containing protein [Deinococcus sp. SL84]